MLRVILFSLNHRIFTKRIKGQTIKMYRPQHITITQVLLNINYDKKKGLDYYTLCMGMMEMELLAPKSFPW